MAKIARVQEVAVSKLRPYRQNAKRHGEEQIEKLKDSIHEFGFLTPCLIDSEYNLIAGHGRVEAAKALGLSTVPCVFIDGLTEAQRRAYILADNRLGELGEWDMATVNVELHGLDAMDFDVDLTGFDLPVDWFESREKWDTDREDGNQEYNEFLDKFELPKTTDDCYTPDNIYDVICGWIEKRYMVHREDFVRPFYPGGDFKKYAYGKSDIVVDNPPFSILAEIVDFYVESNRPFFLFAPGLSALGYTSRNGVAAICLYASITYENKARVPTSFITNLEADDVAAIASSELYDLIETENEKNEEMMSRHLPKYEYPVEVATAAKLGYISRYGQSLIILKSESQFIRALDAQKEAGGGIFGSALLLSEKAAAEKAAAEKAAAKVWSLSEREIEIVKSLGNRDEERDDG